MYDESCVAAAHSFFVCRQRCAVRSHEIVSHIGQRLTLEGASTRGSRAMDCFRRFVAAYGCRRARYRRAGAAGGAPHLDCHARLRSHRQVSAHRRNVSHRHGARDSGGGARRPFRTRAWGARRYGAGQAGTWGAVIGALAGLFFLPLGLLLGPFLGALIGELWAGRSLEDSVRAGWGGLLGTLGSIVVKFAVAVAMTIAFVSKVL